MSFGRRSNEPADSSTLAEPAGQSGNEPRSDAKTDVWDELLAVHGNSATTCHHSSRHTRLGDIADLTTSVVDIYVAGVVVGGVLEASSAMSDIGTGIGGLGAAAEEPGTAEAGLAAASELLGSVFNG